jgi:hypothetical protein
MRQGKYLNWQSMPRKNGVCVKFFTQGGMLFDRMNIIILD